MNQQNNKTVYLHLNPTTQEVFYVGMGKNGRENDFNFNCRSPQWVDYVNTHGKPIVWVVSSSLPKDQAAQYEESIILHYGRLGIEENGILLNQRTGMGANGAVYTQSQLKEMSKRRIGFVFSEEAKLRMSLSHKDKVLSESHKENIGKSISGEKNGNYKRSFSEETKLKLRLANLGKKQSEETIKKRMVALLLKGLIKNTKYVS